MIGIIDYGSGNVHAIGTIHKKLDIPFRIISGPEQVNDCTKLILPGVGDFDETMNLLTKTGLRDVLDYNVIEMGIPIIGFCVGMQVMAEGSEEGDKEGFGWIDGYVKKLDNQYLNRKPHLPHMGWNTVEPLTKDPLWEGIEEQKGFYFLHSFHFQCNNEENIMANSTYGRPFASAIKKKAIYGIQFHPEKSHQNGTRIFMNYSSL